MTSFALGRSSSRSPGSRVSDPRIPAPPSRGQSPPPPPPPPRGLPPPPPPPPHVSHRRESRHPCLRVFHRKPLRDHPRGGPRFPRSRGEVCEAMRLAGPILELLRESDA